MKRSADKGDNNKDQVAPLPAGREAKRARRSGEGDAGGDLPGVRGLDEVLCADVLAAVCGLVESTADLVRLSCVSRTMRQLVASDSLWRARFRQERGEAHHDALALALDLHGPAVLKSFFALDRRPPPLVPLREAFRAFDDDDDDDDDAEADYSAKAAKDVNAAGGGGGEHGLGVWFEALVATDEQLQWRRWMAAVNRTARDEAMRWMESETRVAGQRELFAARIRRWLTQAEAKNEQDEEEGHEEAGEEYKHLLRVRGAAGDDSAYDDDGKLKPPKLETELQKRQVHALLFMTRLNDHFDHRCSDDYRGGDGQYSVATTKVFFIKPEQRQPTAHPQRSLRYSPRGTEQVWWEYAVNTARDDNPDLSKFPEFFDQLRRQLLARKNDDAPSDEENKNEEEGLTRQQFLYFVGVALDLGDKDDDGVGYTPLHSLISQ